MLKIVGILFISAALAKVVHGVSPEPPNAAVPSQEGLARLFFISRVTQQDPLKSMACFTDYIAKSNEISKNYSNDYNDCIVKASERRKLIDAEVFKEREIIELNAEEVCTRMRTCNTHNDTLEVFNCHANLGSNNTRATYTISGNAAEFATLFQERYRLIELHHEQCCHAAERAYVENTAQNYNELQTCLDGRIVPNPPPKPTTTITPTPTTTTTTKSTTSTSAPTPTPTSTTTTTTTPISIPIPTTTTTTTRVTTPTAMPTTTEWPISTTENPQRFQERFAQLLNLLNQ